MKIIYHSPNQKGRSLFDINISDLIKKEKIKIACPYISINYFEDVIIRLSSDFKLLTDINALIKSKNTKKEIEDSCKLLMKYKEKIKHCDSIHAKCIISSKNVFLGSANFTDSAINKKNELSIIIDTLSEIKQINNWFDLWWHESKTLTDLDYENILSYSKNKIEPPKTSNIILSTTSINCYYDLYSDKNSNLFNSKNEEYLINFLKHNNDIIKVFCINLLLILIFGKV